MPPRVPRSVGGWRNDGCLVGKPFASSSCAVESFDRRQNSLPVVPPDDRGLLKPRLAKLIDMPVLGHRRLLRVAIRPEHRGTHRVLLSEGGFPFDQLPPLLALDRPFPLECAVPPRLGDRLPDLLQLVRVMHRELVGIAEDAARP